MRTKAQEIVSWQHFCDLIVRSEWTEYLGRERGIVFFYFTEIREN